MKLHLHLLSAALLTGGSFVGAQVPGAPPPPAADPFVRNDPTAGGGTEVFISQSDRPRYVSICYEAFSLPMADAADLRRQSMPDAQLYQELVNRTKGGSATQEYFSVVCARSGERATLENISELIYPTEFDDRNAREENAATPDPKDPKDAKDPKDSKQTPTPKTEPESAAPALPSSFETRNVGFTLEIEPTIGGNDTIIDLRFAPDTVTFVDRAKWGQGSSSTEMPVFESQRMTTALTLRSGVPMLTGTPSRPPASQQDSDAAKKVWFAFVTGDIKEVP